MGSLFALIGFVGLILGVIGLFRGTVPLLKVKGRGSALAVVLASAVLYGVGGNIVSKTSGAPTTTSDTPPAASAPAITPVAVTKPATYAVTVHTTPAQAHVAFYDASGSAVDDASGPEATLNAKAGAYKAVVTANGYYDKRVKLTLPKNKNVALKLELLPPPEPQWALRVNDWKCHTEYDYFIIEGTLTNVSGGVLENVTAYATVSDSQGVVSTDDALIDFQRLRPGETSNFKTMSATGGRGTKCSVRFGVMFGDQLLTKFPKN